MAGMDEKETAYRFLVGKLEGRRLCGRARHMVVKKVSVEPRLQGIVEVSMMVGSLEFVICIPQTAVLYWFQFGDPYRSKVSN